MPKRYNYRRNYGSRDKYSIEQQCGTITCQHKNDQGQWVNGPDGIESVVPATTVKGMRKVKHITVQMASTSEPAPICYWCIIYVPEGTTPNVIQATGDSMYEPNQYVMAAGVFDFNAGPLRIHTPLARNLNAGDAIALLVKSTESGASFKYMVRYAITLQ